MWPWRVKKERKKSHNLHCTPANRRRLTCGQHTHMGTRSGHHMRMMTIPIKSRERVITEQSNVCGVVITGSNKRPILGKRKKCRKKTRITSCVLMADDDKTQIYKWRGGGARFFENSDINHRNRWASNLFIHFGVVFLFVCSIPPPAGQD